MSSDIYIPMSTVLSHTEHFRFSTDYNVDIEYVYEEFRRSDTDWEYIQMGMQPVLMCHLWPTKLHRSVEVFMNENNDMAQLHICCVASITPQITEWLDDHNFPYTII